MFDAFHNFAVANVQASKVDCLVVAGSDVYVGTADGHVILYSLSFRRGTSGDLVNIKGKELAKKTIGSTKKGVERLVHIRVRELKRRSQQLLALSVLPYACLLND